jgi:hypothetical protein
MLTFPPVMERLEWLQGSDFHLASKLPAVRLMVDGAFRNGATTPD